MNCLQFRRQKLAAPRELSPEQARHLENCQECARFTSFADQFESELASAVQIPVPDGIADRVLLNRKLQPRRQFQTLALAAALLLSIGLVAMYSYVASQEAVGSRMIAHVLSEPEVLSLDANVSPEKVDQALSTVGGTLRASIGRVSFLDNCKGLDPGGTHLVLHTEYGRAAVVLLPSVKQRMRASVTEQGLSATVLPAQKGAIIIVAEAPEIAAKIERWFQDNIRWGKHS